jgi:hypothetical protein
MRIPLASTEGSGCATALLQSTEPTFRVSCGFARALAIGTGTTFDIASSRRDAVWSGMAADLPITVIQ